MTHGDCNSLYTNILLFIDNELPEPGAHELQIHVGECPGCSDRLEIEKSNLIALKRALSGACDEQISSILHEHILEQIHQIAEEQAKFEANPFGAFGEFAGGITQTYISTSFTHTEITENGEVHIQIETHEFHQEFPE